MKTLLRIIKNETFCAYLLIPVGLLAIGLGANFNGHFLEQHQRIGGWHFTIREATLDYLLGFFFYVIGLQLRFELKHGVLQNRKILVVSALSAGMGMAVPALIFYIYNRANGSPTTGWGIEMATDLPFVLAALVIFKKNNLKGFVLALATFDDIGSVIVLSILFKVHLNSLYLLALIATLAIYFLLSYLFSSKAMLIAVFVVGLALAHQSGVQSSLVAVLFGILTSNNRIEGVDLQAKMLLLLEPLSAFVVIPLFVFITLFRRYDFSPHAIGSTLVISLIIVRLIGKPIGIFLGIFLGRALTHLRAPFTSGEALLIGALGTLGLDVSLIFAQKDFLGATQNLAIVGILLTIPAGVLLATVVHLLTATQGKVEV